MSFEELAEKICEQGTSQLNTGKISSAISINGPEFYTTLKLEEKSGFQVVRLDVFNFKEVKMMNNNNWWSTANCRSTFCIQSGADPNKMKVDQIKKIVTDRM